MMESDDVVDFDTAKKRVQTARKEQKEKDIEKRFKKAIGWKEKSKFKVKKSPGVNGPKPKKAPNKPRNKPSKPRGKGK